MTCDAALVGSSIDALVARLGGAAARSAKEELVLRLNAQYPRDVGVLSAFFLNLVSARCWGAAGGGGWLAGGLVGGVGGGGWGWGGKGWVAAGWGWGWRLRRSCSRRRRRGLSAPPQPPPTRAPRAPRAPQISLQAGQAIYLAANEPHAYVSGELVECMATSDNVIRAGLTPKFRDTGVLCDSLTYSQGLPEVRGARGARAARPRPALLQRRRRGGGAQPHGLPTAPRLGRRRRRRCASRAAPNMRAPPPPAQVLNGTPVHDHVKLYQPPFEEFEVLAVDVPAGSTVGMPVNQGPMLLLVQRGAGRAEASGPVSNSALSASLDVARGSILFVPAGASVSLSAAEGEALFIWGAACNRSLFAKAGAAAGAAVPAEAVAA
jgi:hypothetical protein